MAIDRRREEGWLTLDDMARVFDVTPRGFASIIRPLIPADCIRPEGRRVMVYARGAIDAYAAKKQAEVAAAAGADVDPTLFTGTDSPALERLRLANAELKELELSQRRRDLIPRRQVHQGFGLVASILRRAGEILQKQFGRDAHAVIEEALNDADRAVTDTFGAVEPPGASGG
jgi:hypothetical protein